MNLSYIPLHLAIIHPLKTRIETAPNVDDHRVWVVR